MILNYKINFEQFLGFIDFFINNEPDIFLKRIENEENKTNIVYS